MVRLATFLVGSSALAEEAVHDAFLKLHSEWFNVNNHGGFLRTTVANRCKTCSVAGFPLNGTSASFLPLRPKQNATTWWMFCKGLVRNVA